MSNVIEGEVSIKSMEKAIQYFSDYKNLISCIPGVKEISENNFKAQVKISFLTVEINGSVKKHKISENNIDTLIVVEGPGIVANIDTLLTLTQNNIKWKSNYEISGPLANSLRKYIESEAEELSRKIIECSVSKINES
ncbi:MAG: SRPBCC domain-containing protein [Saccharolobus sp.]